MDENNSKEKLDMIESILDQPFRKADITQREKEIAKLIAYGYKLHEVAEVLNIATSTVGTYIQKIKTKIGLSKNELTKFVFLMLLDVIRTGSYDRYLKQLKGRKK